MFEKLESTKIMYNAKMSCCGLGSNVQALAQMRNQLRENLALLLRAKLAAAFDWPRVESKKNQRSREEAEKFLTINAIILGAEKNENVACLALFTSVY